MKPVMNSRPLFANAAGIGIVTLSLLLATSPMAQATTYYWDSDGNPTIGTPNTSTAGSGVWDTSSANWFVSGATDTTYVNGANDINFGGADGTYTITVGSPITVARVYFLNSGYTLSAASPTKITVDPNQSLTSFRSAAGVTMTLGNNVTIENGSTATGNSLSLTGDSSTSKIIVDGGATVSATSGAVLYIGSNAATANSAYGATVQVNAGGKISGSNSVVVNGLLDVKGGLVSTAATLAIGNIASTSSVANLTIESGTVSVGGASGVRFGTSSAASTYGGTINLKGGVLTTSKVWSSGAANTSAVYFDGGTIRASTTNNTDFFAAGSTGINTALVRAGGATIDTNGYNVTIGKGLTHDSGVTTDGGLTKISAGTLTLTGANTYNGATTIQSGTLALGSTGSIANSSTIIAGSLQGNAATLDVSAVSGGFHVLSGQTLKGFGTVNGALTIDNGATLAPGNDATGTLTVKNNVVFQGNLSKLLIRLGETSLNDSDQLATISTSAETVTLNGALLDVTLGASYSHENGALFLILDNANSASVFSGTFSQGSQITVGGETFNIIYGANYDSTGSFVSMTGGNDIALEAVPEPTTWAIFVGGLGMLGAFQRLRRKA